MWQTYPDKGLWKTNVCSFHCLMEVNIMFVASIDEWELLLCCFHTWIKANDYSFHHWMEANVMFVVSIDEWELLLCCFHTYMKFNVCSFHNRVETTIDCFHGWMKVNNMLFLLLEKKPIKWSVCEYWIWLLGWR
jgi:hypothetical protein